VLQAFIAVQFTGHKKFNVETDSKVALSGAPR
jgi:hypothetical protein